MRLKIHRFKLLLVIYVPFVLIFVLIIKYNVFKYFGRIIDEIFLPQDNPEVPNQISHRHLNHDALSALFSNHILNELKSEEKPHLRLEDLVLYNGSHKLWYFSKRKDLITTADVSQLPLFHKDDPMDDRIRNQLLYMPPNYESYRDTVTLGEYKKIFLEDGPGAFYKVKYGTSNFAHCPVNSCVFVKKNSEADLIVYKNTNPSRKTRPDQIHMVYILESPFHYGHLKGPFDWTSTYRRDSDIVAPYGRWDYYDKGVTQIAQNISYAKGKTKKVAWFVSNCNAKNNRLEIARELNDYITVDMYGYCSETGLECPRSSEKECFKMLQRDYKFYLSFENSNCRDYVTEKYFLNALENNVIPVVMGGSPEDYRKMSPQKSFIHVDDFDSVASLGAYLNLLDNDDVLYDTYFKWKGTGEMIDAHYWCRVCSMLHIPIKDKQKYRLSDISFRKWWLGRGVCNRKNWKRPDNTTLVSQSE